MLPKQTTVEHDTVRVGQAIAQACRAPPFPKTRGNGCGGMTATGRVLGVDMSVCMEDGEAVCVGLAVWLADGAIFRTRWLP